MIWQQIIVAIVLQVISSLFRPKPESPNPATTEDLDVPTAQEGDSMRVIFGTPKMQNSNIVYYSAVSTKAVKSKGGKK